MIGRRTVVLAALLAVSPRAVASTATAELDDLHAHRDQPGAVARAQKIADAAVAASPDDYGVLWRATRAYFDASEETGLPRDQRSRLGARGWELAQRATAADARGVAGYYWGALAIGSSAAGMGMLRALASGIEAKFTGALARATELDPGYDHGNIYVAWGAYYMELPWPKRDRGKAEESFRRALAINPDNLRARFYLARLFAQEGKTGDERAALDEIGAAAVGRYDPPEERRVKKEAAEMRAKL